MVSAITDSGQMWSKCWSSGSYMVAHLKNTAEPPRIHGWMEIWTDGLVFLLFSFCIDVVCEFDFSRFSIRFRLLVFVLPFRTQDICFVTFTTRVSSPTVVGNPAELLGPGTRNHTKVPKAQVVACKLTHLTTIQHRQHNTHQ